MSSEANTDRCAAVPVAPALGGKLNSTMASLRSPTGVARSATIRATRAARAAARPGWLFMSWVATLSVLSERPPKTIGEVAPSSSGIATMIVDSTG